MKTKSFIYDLGDARTAIVLTELKGGGPMGERFLIVCDGYDVDQGPEEYYREYYISEEAGDEAFAFLIRAQIKGMLRALER